MGKELTSADGHSVTYLILDDDVQSRPDFGMPQPILPARSATIRSIRRSP